MKDGKNGFIEHTTMMIIIALCLRRQHNSKRLSHWVGSTLTPTQYFACLNYRLMLVNQLMIVMIIFYIQALICQRMSCLHHIGFVFRQGVDVNFYQPASLAMSCKKKQLGAFLPDLLRFQCQRGSRASLF